MIDWITATLPCSHFPLRGGTVSKVDREGEVEWTTSCYIPAVGSFESKLMYKSGRAMDGEGRATHIELSGNPAKFLQGHNVFGSDDLLGLVYDVYLRICELEGIVPCAAARRAVAQGDYALSKVDITYSFELPSRVDVRSWLRASEYCSRSRAGRPTTRSGTLYWGQHSSRWAIKAYSKGDEIESKKKGHGLPCELEGSPIKDWADNKLRVELVMRKKQLEEMGISTARVLAGQCAALYQSFLEKITMTGQLRLSDVDLHELPRSLVSTYTLWLEGHNLRAMLSKPTFYRHRAALMKFSIDIALTRENSGQSNVVPLIRVLQAEPVSTPEWAYELGLVHVPTRHLSPQLELVV